MRASTARPRDGEESDVSDGKHPPRTARVPVARGRGPHFGHPMPAPPVPPGTARPPGVPAPPVPDAGPRISRRRSLFVRFAPTLSVVSIVLALAGGGVWFNSTTPRDAARSDLTARKAIPEGEDPDAVALVVNVPGGVSTSALRGAEGSPAFTGYLARPGAAITLPAQRVAVVSARRDDTLDRIAARTGVTAGALMYANGIADPARTLTVGQAVRVPPGGTMLHRVKEGDTLEGIARAYRVNLDEMTKYPGNNVQQTGDLIPGGFMIVPTTNAPVRDRVVFYQVREGDSLAKITALYGLKDVRTLRWANDLQGAIVLPEQVIAIPPTDGVIHVVESDDLRRATEDAITQIAKNYACTATPCAAAPTDERVNAVAAAIFAFGPNHLTRGGRLVPGQEITVPGGVPFAAALEAVAIPENVRIDNPTATSGGTGNTSLTVTRRTVSLGPTPAPVPATSGGNRPAATAVPASGNRAVVVVAPTRPPVAVAAPSYSGGGVAGTASRYLGQYRQPSGVPWAGYCEKFVGDVAAASGVGITRYPTAISHAYAGPLLKGRAPAGTLVFFDTSWNSAGHVGIAMGDGTMVSALNGGIVHTSYERSGGYMGWRPTG